MEKRYYWLKLQEDFFKSKRIKKLRKIAGGDTYTIIYLKMQLLSVSKGGFIEYSGLEPTFAEEVALDIDEDADDVLITINYLLSCGLMETSDGKEYALPFAVSNIGSEGESAERVRKHREKQKMLQSNGDVTKCNNNVLSISISNSISKSNKPTVEEVKAYIKEMNYHFDAESFVAFYDSNGWKVGKNPMKNWKSACVTWEKNHKPKAKATNFNNFENRSEDIDEYSKNKLLEKLR